MLISSFQNNTFQKGNAPQSTSQPEQIRQKPSDLYAAARTVPCTRWGVHLPMTDFTNCAQAPGNACSSPEVPQALSGHTKAETL